MSGRFLSVALLLTALSGCGFAEPYDLAITNARVLDVHTGRVLPGRSVLIRGGRIAAVTPGTSPLLRATRTIDGAGRLLTPGFVDAHFHSGDTVGDTLDMSPDSLRTYRARFARAYLPFGVTTVRSCGDNPRWMPMLLDWARPGPDAPDFHPCGAALISPDDRNFSGHVEVNGPDSARAKVREYHALGLRHLKVYWRLREPEFAAAMEEARSLQLNVTGHVDAKVLGIDRALDLGLRQFEHAYTLGVDAIDSTGWAYVNGPVFVDHYAPWIRGNSIAGSFFISRIEIFNLIGEENPAMRALIQRLRETGSGVTPTLHVFAQRFGLTRFRTPPRRPGYDDAEVLGDSALVRCREGYRILGVWVCRLHEAGVPLCVGSDWADPGPACLSEMLLLHGCGLTLPEVLVAATWNGARAIGRQREIGAVSPGYRANLVLFDADPLDRAENLLLGKTVIKDGVVHAPDSAPR